MTHPLTFLGRFCHTPKLGAIECLENTLIEVDEAGLIRRIVPPQNPDHAHKRSQAAAAGKLHALSGYILPGFCDLHVHAPQWPQLGKALDVPLEVWLQTHTFPLEARYHDLAFAEKAYSGLVDDLLSNGTTTAMYFATVHQAATRLLADICLRKGQRALIGKVVMDHKDECPTIYRDDTTELGLTGTQDFIDFVRRHPDNTDQRIRPVVTPRFIASCTDEALEALGQMARSCQCHVQTHCSESDWEHNYVLARHGMSDTESLDRFGLLTRHTIRLTAIS